MIQDTLLMGIFEKIADLNMIYRTTSQDIVSRSMSDQNERPLMSTVRPAAKVNSEPIKFTEVKDKRLLSGYTDGKKEIYLRW